MLQRSIQPACPPHLMSKPSHIVLPQYATGELGWLELVRQHVGSLRYGIVQSRFGAGVDILVQACPGLVEQVEAGDLSGDKTRALLTKYEITGVPGYLTRSHYLQLAAPVPPDVETSVRAALRRFLAQQA